MYPSLVEVDRSGIGLDPSSVEVDCGCIASVALREEFGTPCVVTNPPRWRFPRWEYSGLEILLGEGRDVELGARTSEHIFVFAFDPLVS